MLENKFRDPAWMKEICVSETNDYMGSKIIESYYEMNTRSLFPAFIDLGCVKKFNGKINLYVLYYII